MKQLSPIAFVAGALLLTACSSTDNAPSELTGDDTYVSFNINVAQNSTRAASDQDEGMTGAAADDGTYATTDESAVANVKLYVFNNSVFETELTVAPTADGKSYKTGAQKVKLGQKLIYVVTGTDKISLSPVSGTSITDFDKMLFDAANTNIAVSSDFVMIGKSEAKMVVKCDDQNNIPASNQFSLTIERAAAKAQVKFVNEEGGSDNVVIASTLNVDFGTYGQYAIQQTAKKMRIDWHSDYTDGSTGTSSSGVYNGYNTSSEYSNTVTAFSATNCTYLSENWVESPTTGNTTYAGVKFTVTPKAYSEWSSTDNKLVDATSSASEDGTFYTVARRNRWHGYIYYALVDNKNVYFTSEADATAYATALNGETLTDADDSLTNTTQQADAGFLGKYEVVAFTGGDVYYRVNLQRSTSTTLSDKYRVDRNNFVQISIDKINALGKPSDGIVPGNPDEPLESETYIECTFTLRPWYIVPMGVELD